MNGKAIILEIKRAVNDVKQKNQDVISVDALLNYLDVLEKDASETDDINHRQHEANLAEYRAENERNIAHYNAQQLHHLYSNSLLTNKLKVARLNFLNN